jgi:hypothetical protein
MPTAVELLLEENPTWQFMLSDPELSALLQEAADPNSLWSPQKFQGKLYQTTWFQSRSQAQREFDILQQTDPGEAANRVRQYQLEVQNLGDQLGFQLSGEEIQYIAGVNTRNGVDLNDPAQMYMFRRYVQSLPGLRFTEGKITGTEGSYAKMARSEYYVGMDQNRLRQLAIDTELGYIDEKTARDAMIQQAVSWYPHLAVQLLSGNTMKDMFNGHVNTVAEELELDPESINMIDSKWKWIVNGAWDHQSQSWRPYTIGEARAYARKDDSFWNTTNGRALDAETTNNILKQFGKVA